MTTVKGTIHTAHYATEISTGSGKTIIADEPLASGGNDAGLNPGELFNASLASCTAMTMRMYADRKQWPLKSAEVFITSEHDENIQNTTIQCEIILYGDELTDEQRKRLIEIAQHCPLHKMLTHPITINTVVK